MIIGKKIHNLLHPKLGKILMLHSISSAKYLDELVKQCRADGFEPISINEVAVRLKKHGKRKFACFTFDDGYLDTYSIAFPTLVKLKVPFCVYLARDFYRGTAHPIWDTEAKMLNVEQLKEMSENSLCTIGVHTCSHPHLSKLDAEQQLHEIANCKSDLEDLLGKEMRHFAYPHGDYGRTTVQIVSELGFVTAVTTSGRHVRGDSKLLELDRVFV